MSDNKPIYFEFRFTPLSSSPEGILLRYLKATELHPAETKNDLVLRALKLVWLPYAYRDVGETSQGELRGIASEVVSALEWHVRELRISFGLEAKEISQLYASPAQSSSNVLNQKEEEPYLVEDFDDWADEGL